MKRLLLAALVMGLFAASLAPAQAAKKPSKVTFYLHGTEQLGEADMVSGLGAYQRMDTTAPDGATPKSWGVSIWGGAPWNDCAGSPFLPVWTAGMSGTVKGDIKVRLHTAGAPGSVELQIWADLAGMACASNDTSTGTYPPPTVSAIVDLPAGPGVTEVVIENTKFKVQGILMLQIRPAGGPYPGRYLYDAADYASSVEFSCIPASGKSCV